MKLMANDNSYIFLYNSKYWFYKCCATMLQFYCTMKRTIAPCLLLSWLEERRGDAIFSICEHIKQCAN